MSTIRPRGSDGERPYGVDADACTAIGILCKILMMVILHYCKGSFVRFVGELEIREHLNFVTTQATWYRRHQAWDPRTTSSKDKRLRFSRIRQAIVSVYNIKNADELIIWCKSNTMEWRQGYEEGNALLNKLQAFLRQLIAAQGKQFHC